LSPGLRLRIAMSVKPRAMVVAPVHVTGSRYAVTPDRSGVTLPRCLLVSEHVMDNDRQRTESQLKSGVSFNFLVW